jgi:hypothetical protein
MKLGDYLFYNYQDIILLITLLLLSVFSWVHSKKGVQMSKSREDRFDQPEESAKWLKTIRDINTDYLSKVPKKPFAFENICGMFQKLIKNG